jgi:hypothetical protein
MLGDLHDPRLVAKPPPIPILGGRAELETDAPGPADRRQGAVAKRPLQWLPEIPQAP